MKIKEVKCFPLRVQLNRSIGFSQWYYGQKNNCVVKVLTEEGLVGWGECYGPNLAICAAIEHHFAPLLKGKNVMQNEILWNFMWKSFSDFNRHGILMSAISGLDIAFWDLKGKFLNTPVRTLLGGSDEDIECYATGMYYHNDVTENKMLEELLKEAEGYVNNGYTILKIKVGKNIKFDEKIIYSFRERFPNIQLAADSNHA